MVVSRDGFCLGFVGFVGFGALDPGDVGERGECGCGEYRSVGSIERSMIGRIAEGIAKCKYTRFPK